VLLVSFAVPLASWAVTGEPRPRSFLLPLTLLGLFAVARALVRRRFVVDEAGVDLARRGARVPWSQVDHVRRPTTWDTQVVLVLTDGEQCPTPYPADLAERLASVGGVRLEG
jgi:hypothetical protein